jgi:hypothetical protein
MLTKRLGEKEREWWLKILAYALHGRPSRRFYQVEGRSGGGKTCMVNALRGALGEYASEPLSTALAPGRHEAGGASPELEKVAHPYRLAMFDDINLKSVSPAIIKQICGDGTVTFRRLYEPDQTRLATATPLLFANPGRAPRLPTEDEAIAARIRVLPYPQVPRAERDRGLKARTRGRPVHEALLKRLVKYAAGLDLDEGPPDDVPTVKTATAERIQEDVGPLGRFAQRLEETGNPEDVLTSRDLWLAWCRDQGAPDDSEKVGGISHGWLARKLRAARPDLPTTTMVQNQRGWVGWRLRGDPVELPEVTDPKAPEKIEEAQVKVTARRQELWRSYGWPESWVMAAKWAREVRDDSSGETDYEPVFWPNEHDLRPEANYLQRRLLALKPEGLNPLPESLAFRVRSWLVWNSYLSVVDSAIVAAANDDLFVAVLPHEGTQPVPYDMGEPGSCNRPPEARPVRTAVSGRGRPNDSASIVPDYGKAPSGALRCSGRFQGSPLHGGHPDGAWRRLYRTAAARARLGGRAEGPRRREDRRRGRRRGSEPG